VTTANVDAVLKFFSKVHLYSFNYALWNQMDFLTYCCF